MNMTSTAPQSHSEPLSCLAKLVEHVVDHRDRLIVPISYKELAARIGRLNKHGIGHGHGMGNVLGNMGRLLQDLEGRWGEPIPQIQSLVVNLNGPLKNLPDEGIKGFWPDYPHMTRIEKTNRVRIEHQRIAEYGSRWNDVLDRFGIPPVDAVNAGKNDAPRQRGAGGESDQHRRLKEYVRSNPHIVGAGNDWQSFVEYPLPTLDSIDVLFKSSDACIAVEVKSAVSDGLPSDYERGLFQTVKYGAVLAAMSEFPEYRIPPRIESVLVLESHLPDQYRRLALSLSVTLSEGVKVPKTT